MAMASDEMGGDSGFTTSKLSFEERVLDHLRYRMSTITASLLALRQDIENPQIVLPPW